MVERFYFCWGGRGPRLKKNDDHKQRTHCCCVLLQDGVEECWVELTKKLPQLTKRRKTSQNEQLFDCAGLGCVCTRLVSLRIMGIFAKILSSVPYFEDLKYFPVCSAILFDHHEFLALILTLKYLCDFLLFNSQEKLGPTSSV